MRSGCWLSFVLLLFPFHATDSFAGIKLEIKPEKTTLFPGEPCLLSIIYMNDTTHEIHLSLGREDMAHLSFIIFDNDRQILASGEEIPSEAGWSTNNGEHNIPAGKSISTQVILNRWCSTMLEEGDYIVQCMCNQKDSPKLVSDCSISVKMIEQTEINRIFSNLLADARESKNAGRRILSMDLLSNTNNPSVVPFFDKAIRDQKLDLFFKRKAMDGLERIGTKEAASSIVSLGQPEEQGGVSSDIIRNELISAACRLRDKSPDPEVREIARQLGGTIPSQEKPEVYD